MTWPSGAGLSDFAWRVSLAEVAKAGPFSRFESVDRILTVLEGELLLNVGADEAVRLTFERPPYAFRGDEPTDGGPVGGIVRDLNVMCRRGLWIADVRRVAVDPEPKALNILGAAMLVVACGDLRLTSLERTYDLEALDAVFMRGAPDVQLRSIGGIAGICVVFHQSGEQVLDC